MLSRSSTVPYSTAPYDNHIHPCDISIHPCDISIHPCDISIRLSQHPRPRNKSLIVNYGQDNSIEPRLAPAAQAHFA
jgi:hypothetical protein